MRATVITCLGVVVVAIGLASTNGGYRGAVSEPVYNDHTASNGGGTKLVPGGIAVMPLDPRPLPASPRPVEPAAHYQASSRTVEAAGHYQAPTQYRPDGSVVKWAGEEDHPEYLAMAKANRERVEREEAQKVAQARYSAKIAALSSLGVSHDINLKGPSAGPYVNEPENAKRYMIKNGEGGREQAWEDSDGDCWIRAGDVVMHCGQAKAWTPKRDASDDKAIEAIEAGRDLRTKVKGDSPRVAEARATAAAERAAAVKEAEAERVTARLTAGAVRDYANATAFMQFAKRGCTGSLQEHASRIEADMEGEGTTRWGFDFVREMSKARERVRNDAARYGAFVICDRITAALAAR